MTHPAGFHPVLKRQLIREQLEYAFHYPLTLVIAAMGYGKTVAARDFIEGMQAEHVWLDVESDETPAHIIWESLTRKLAAGKPEIGDRLKTLGFPISAMDRNRVFDLLEEWAYLSNKVLVIDDYHFAKAPELDFLLEKLVRRKIKGLHIMILSRTSPAMNIQDLKLKGYCHQLESSLFELSGADIKQYFRLFGVDISNATAGQVREITEGWITSVYLVCQGYLKTGRLEAGLDLRELISKTIMAHYSGGERSLLMSLAALDSFTLPQAEYVTGNKAAAEIIQKLSRDSSFIRLDAQSGKYMMHNIFSEYLRGLLETEPDQAAVFDLYRRDGEWQITHGYTLSGLRQLLKARAYDLILEEFEQPDISRRITRMFDPAVKDIVNLFEQIPLEVKYRHPIGYITFIDFYLARVDLRQGARLLAEIEAYYERDNITPPDLKRQITGEIELVKAFIHFNDLRKTHACCARAHELLDGKSRIANPDMIFTYGCPSTLFLYHRKAGDLLGLVEFVEQNYSCYEDLSGGCGKGFESLIRAEYCLESGELDQAELHAYKAIYQAETLEQVSMVICASFVLVRISAARGKYGEAKGLLDELAVRVAESNNPIFLDALDLCYGYLGGITNDPLNFAQWLQTGEMKQDIIFYQGLGFNYLVHARYLLLEGNYLKLEAFCGELHRIFSPFNNLLGHLQAYILDAIVKNQLYGPEIAEKALQQALALGRADGIIMPFAEYGQFINTILSAVADREKNDPYLDRLLKAVSHYRSNLEAAGRNEEAVFRLTEREMEILKLLLEGKQNREIAGILFIAEVTVKKAISSIYRKLGVSSRAAAVRKTIELKLI